MPHQCTNCDRTFDDGSKEMLSGCPDCGGNKFQFKPAGEESVDTAAEPPDPPEPSGGSSVAQTVGKTAATVKDLMGSATSEPEAQSTPSQRTDADRFDDPDTTARPAPEDTAQASARTDVVSVDELPSEPSGDGDHHFQPVQTDEGSSVAPETTDGADSASTDRVSVDDSETEQAADARADRPGLEELREELNDQFESIKVLEPGQYELNLMELYDREEYIVALQEDGRYSIQVPENFRD